MCWLYETAVQKISDLPADLLLLLRTQPARGLLDKNCPRGQQYLMTDSLCQAHVMLSTAEHVVVFTQQLRRSLALPVACAATTGRLIQLFDVWWDGRPTL